jgi:hypothetical protein
MKRAREKAKERARERARERAERGLGGGGHELNRAKWGMRSGRRVFKARENEAVWKISENLRHPTPQILVHMYIPDIESKQCDT